MTFNPDEFQATLLDTKKSGLYLNENITIEKKNIKVVSNMLGAHIDSKLNFDLNIDIICKSA